MISSDSIYEAGRGKRLLANEPKYDVFVSAFNLSERVSATFDRIDAKQKCWLIHNEYCFEPQDLPKNAPMLQSTASAEAEFILEALEKLQPSIGAETRLCVDITGFMRPHLIFLLGYLKTLGLSRLDLVYTEPSQYMRKADTVFSFDITSVRQVNGYEGTHSVQMTTDVLVVGVGYDHELVSHVIANKSGARLVQLLSLPSLSADMYQESLVRLNKVADAPAKVPDEQLAYSSANDPFAVYLALSEAIQKIAARHKGFSNLYLSPLATKPQAVGFALYYLKHLSTTAASIIFPFANQYSKETSRGVGRAWLYGIEF